MMLLVPVMVSSAPPSITPGVLYIDEYGHDFHYRWNTTLNINVPVYQNWSYVGLSPPDGKPYCNISIRYPNESILYSSVKMSNSYHNYYNVTVNDTTSLGEHHASIICWTNTSRDIGEMQYYITMTGYPDSYFAFDNLLLIYSLIVALIVGGLLWSFLMMLDKLMQWNVYLNEVSISMGLYFAIFFMLQFSNDYINSYAIHSWLEWAVYIGAYTHVVIPLTLFMVCWIKRLIPK